MKKVPSSAVRALAITALMAVQMAGASFAQTPAAQAAATARDSAAATPAASSLPDKSIQRIRTEDAGTRIDEVRVGGETQSITVQPKTGTNLPSYEVRPSDATRGSAPSSSSNDTNGPRVWNVLKF